jgi:hypothetical protein
MAFESLSLETTPSFTTEFSCFHRPLLNERTFYIVVIARTAPILLLDPCHTCPSLVYETSRCIGLSHPPLVVQQAQSGRHRNTRLIKAQRSVWGSLALVLFPTVIKLSANRVTANKICEIGVICGSLSPKPLDITLDSTSSPETFPGP